MSATHPFDRFLALVDRRSEAECWPWQGSTIHGYGQFAEDHDTTVRAHRFGFEMWRGEIPDGMTLDHECHNADLDCAGGDDCPHRRCVNPSHLAIQSAGQNKRNAQPHRRAHRAEVLVQRARRVDLTEPRS